MPRLTRLIEGAPSSADLAVLLVDVTARQAASKTAGTQADLARTGAPACRFAPQDGRFNAEAAKALSEWKGE